MKGFKGSPATGFVACVGLALLLMSPRFTLWSPPDSEQPSISCNTITMLGMLVGRASCFLGSSMAGSVVVTDLSYSRFVFKMLPFKSGGPGLD